VDYVLVTVQVFFFFCTYALRLPHTSLIFVQTQAMN